MADITGFKLEKIKKNLIDGPETDFFDPTKFFQPYFNYINTRDQTLPGYTRGQTLEAEKLIQGKEYGGHGIGPNFPNEIYELLTKEVKKLLDSGEWFNKEFNDERNRQAEQYGGQGITDERLQSAASKIGDKISADFESRFGRPATQSELATIFNRTNFSSSVLANPDRPEKLLTSVDYEATLKDFESKLPIIDQANLSLRNIGKELTQEELDKLLARGLTPERADVMANSIVSSLYEADAKEVQQGVEGRQTSAIDKLDTDLRASNRDTLREDVEPAIIAALRNRGLVPGPELTNVLVEEAGKADRQRESTIAPLRAQVALQAPERDLAFAISGAAEAGKYKSSAMDFLRSTDVLGREQGFQANQYALNRSAQERMSAQNMAIQLALMGRQPQGPNGLDYFLQYGLPVVSSFANAKWGSGKKD